MKAKKLREQAAAYGTKPSRPQPSRLAAFRHSRGEPAKTASVTARLYNGPANISANVRIVLPGDPPATHVDTADLWLMTEGTAIARTDGEIASAR